jgi:hypothetical protein
MDVPEVNVMKCDMNGELCKFAGMRGDNEGSDRRMMGRAWCLGMVMRRVLCKIWLYICH